MYILRLVLPRRKITTCPVRTQDSGVDFEDAGIKHAARCTHRSAVSAAAVIRLITVEATGHAVEQMLNAQDKTIQDRTEHTHHRWLVRTA